VQRQCRLLFLALDRHKAHVGPRHAFAASRRVDRVVLAALDGVDGLSSTAS